MCCTASVDSKSNISLHYLQKLDTAKELVIFIQGLGGTAYKVVKTENSKCKAVNKNQCSNIIYSAFCNQLLNLFPNSNIALLEYPVGLLFYRNEEAESFKQVLANCKSELASAYRIEYNSLVFIGHCLGGFIATNCLPTLLLDYENKKIPKPISKIKSCAITVFLLDAPYDVEPDKISNWFQGLMTLLQLSEADFHNNAIEWRVLLDEFKNTNETQFYSVLASEPSWVSDLMPTADLAPEQVFYVNQSHDQLLKMSQVKPYSEVIMVIEKHLNKTGVST